MRVSLAIPCGLNPLFCLGVQTVPHRAYGTAKGRLVVYLFSIQQVRAVEAERPG